MKKRNENHCKQILNWLNKFGSITQDEAISLFRCYRLSARIFDLRKQGNEIETDMVYSTDENGYPMKYARYRKVS